MALATGKGRLLSSLFLAAFVVGCGRGSSVQDEWDVYRTVVALPPPSLAGQEEPLFVRSTDLPGDGIPDEALREYLRETGHHVSDKLLDSLIAANVDPVRLDDERMGPAARRLLDDEGDRRLSANLGDGWRAIKEIHGRGAETFQVSRPGFNAAGDTAIVHLTHSCGPQMCSSGELIVLVRGDGAWVLADRVDAWVW